MTFPVELHQDDVLEVLLVVGLRVFRAKQEDKCQRKIHGNNYDDCFMAEIFNFSKVEKKKKNGPGWQSWRKLRMCWNAKIFYLD